MLKKINILILLIIIGLFAIPYGKKILGISTPKTASQTTLSQTNTQTSPTILHAEFNYTDTQDFSNSNTSVNIQEKPQESPFLSALFWHKASYSDLIEQLDKGYSLAPKTASGKTYLMAASAFNTKTDVINELITLMPNEINTRDTEGKSALMYAAAYNNNPFVILALLDNGANINARDLSGRTALSYAAQYNKNPQILSILLKKGASINERDKNGWTALMRAAQTNQNPEIIRFLVSYGADINTKLPKKNNEFKHAAIENILVKSIKLSLKEAQNLLSDLYKLTDKENPQTITSVLDQHLDSFTSNFISKETGMTPLLIAAKYNPNPQILETLIEQGADIGVYDADGKNVIDYATKNPALNQTPIFWHLNDLLYQD